MLPITRPPTAGAELVDTSVFSKFIFCRFRGPLDFAAILLSLRFMAAFCLSICTDGPVLARGIVGNALLVTACLLAIRAFKCCCSTAFTGDTGSFVCPLPVAAFSADLQCFLAAICFDFGEVMSRPVPDVSLGRAELILPPTPRDDSLSPLTALRFNNDLFLSVFGCDTLCRPASTCFSDVLLSAKPFTSFEDVLFHLPASTCICDVLLYSNESLCFGDVSLHAPAASLFRGTSGSSV